MLVRNVKVLWPWAAIALAAMLAVALRPASAPAEAQPLLLVNVASGHINVGMIAPKDSAVTFFEEVATGREELGKGTAVAPTAAGEDGLASIPAFPWRCDRNVRRLVGRAVTKDGRTIEAVNEARTPDCKERIALRAPKRVEPGERVSITLKDRWQIGDLKVRLCVSRTGAARRCSRLTFAPGEKTLVLSRAAGKRVALMDLDLVVAGSHRHHKVGIGRKAPAAPRPVAIVTGDSMMQGIDTILTEKLKSKYRVIGQTRPGTGVSKSLDTPWTTFARQQATKHRPAVTIVLLGGNDGYPMKTPDGQQVECCGDAWRTEYAGRITDMAKAYAREGLGTVVWSLLPPPKRSELVGQMSAVNEAIEKMGAAVPGVQLVRLDRIFGPSYRDEIDGRQVRDPDGLHFNLAGQRIAAQAIIEALRKAAPAS